MKYLRAFIIRFLYFQNRSVRIIRRFLGLRYVVTAFHVNKLHFDTYDYHEYVYYKFVKTGKAKGPLIFDVWVFSNLIESGQAVLDAGANIGFTAVLAKTFGAGEIHCFEPDERLWKKISRNCNYKNYFLYQSAVGRKIGKQTLNLSSLHFQGSTLNLNMKNTHPKVFKSNRCLQVNVDTVDNIFSEKKINSMKIDVEGAELDLLFGSKKILDSNPPEIIYIEAYPSFFEETHLFLSQFYNYSYRIICKRNGSGKLVPFDTDISKLPGNSFLISSPPSYIYSLRDLRNLGNEWLKPGSYKKIGSNLY